MKHLIAEIERIDKFMYENDIYDLYHLSWAQIYKSPLSDIIYWFDGDYPECLVLNSANIKYY